MRMGNFFSSNRLASVEMSTKQPRLGVAHVTVVPTNFEMPDSVPDGKSAPRRQRDSEE